MTRKIVVGACAIASALLVAGCASTSTEAGAGSHSGSRRPYVDYATGNRSDGVTFTQADSSGPALPSVSRASVPAADQQALLSTLRSIGVPNEAGDKKLITWSGRVCDEIHNPGANVVKYTQGEFTYGSDSLTVDQATNVIAAIKSAFCH